VERNAPARVVDLGFPPHPADLSEGLSPHASPHRSIDTTLSRLLLLVSLVEVVEQTVLDESRERASVSVSVAVAVLLLLLVVVLVVLVVVVVTDGAPWWCVCKNDQRVDGTMLSQVRKNPHPREAWCRKTHGTHKDASNQCDNTLLARTACVMLLDRISGASTTTSRDSMSVCVLIDASECNLPACVQ
jgi:hypothetical protein